jgi:hypothetical protein
VSADNCSITAGPERNTYGRNESFDLVTPPEKGFRMNEEHLAELRKIRGAVNVLAVIALVQGVLLALWIFGVITVQFEPLGSGGLFD